MLGAGVTLTPGNYTVTPLGGSGHIVLLCQVQGSDTRTSAFSINLGSSNLTWTVRDYDCNHMQLACRCLRRPFPDFWPNNTGTSLACTLKF